MDLVFLSENRCSHYVADAGAADVAHTERASIGIISGRRDETFQQRQTLGLIWQTAPDMEAFKNVTEDRTEQVICSQC